MDCAPCVHFNLAVGSHRQQRDLAALLSAVLSQTRDREANLMCEHLPRALAYVPLL